MALFLEGRNGDWVFVKYLPSARHCHGLLLIRHYAALPQPNEEVFVSILQKMKIEAQKD